MTGIGPKSFWLFRGAALLLLTIVAMKPAAVRPDPSLPKRWAVLVDTSTSMKVKDPEGRLERAKALAAALLDKFPQNQLFTFSDGAGKISAKDLGAQGATGKRTDIAAALKGALGEGDYRGAVILTDGRPIGSDDPVSVAAAAGRPLLLVGIGNGAMFRDVSVRGIQSPPFAFKNVQTSLVANISVVGFAGQQVTVKLREGERVLGIQNVKVSGNDVETAVSFSWIPRSLGSKVLTVEAGQYAGEATTLNNRKEITLDVGRDRFRVLYICGEPGPEYGFLRHQFKSDPAVELVTFVILRNASNVVAVPESELSLIPFPTQDVLINQMATFDLVVFEEFSYQLYGLMPGVLTAIRQKVLDGGSFLLTGGPAVFGQGSGYALPGIQEMIPVEMGSPSISVLSDSARFIAKAPSHPILRLEPNAERNREIWQQLPPLDEVALIPRAKEQATVLGTVSAGGKEYPVLTVWKHGKGRVAALTARTTWRWSMLAGARAQADVYQQFWKNMVLWLTHSDEFKTVRVAFEDKELRVDEPESVRVWAYDEYFKPISDVDVRLQATYPDGTHESLAAHPETTGVFSAPFKSSQLGVHTIDAWVTRKGARFGQDRVQVRVTESHFEEEDLRPDFETLRDLAQATGGKFILADEFTTDVVEDFDREISNKAGRKVLLWNSPWVLGFFLLVLCVEWALRKKRGLP